MARSRREIGLPYREIHISCPHCRVPLVIGNVMDTILMSRRNCPKCGNEFLIENDVAKKRGRQDKKPSGSVKPIKTAQRSGKSR
jgi:DNA-directed RNA polymerase subunit M/transcription elongation factor TFIIS